MRVNVEEIVIPELEDSNPRKRYWTDEEDAILRKYYGKAELSKISEYLKRTKRAIENRASVLGITHRTGDY
jgi:hypothetical protein